MASVQRWTGAETKALRLAMRQTSRGFAEHLGVEPRTVAKWEQRGETITLLPESQALLDTALRRASAEVQERFRDAIGAQAPAESDAEPDGAPSDWVLVPVEVNGQEVFVPVDRRTLLKAGLGAAVGLGGDDKRGTESAPAHRLRLTTANQIADCLDHLRDQWHLLVRTDNLFGPRHAVRGVLDQLLIIEDLLGSVRADARREVVGLGARYAESASWLFEDSGDLGAANRWNTRAMEWAHQADDQAMVSWTLYRRSQQASADGDAADVIGLAQAAGRHGRLPAPMRAAITQQEAQGHALDGDEVTAQRMLDEAHQWAASDVAGDARGGHGSFCTASYLELQRAASWLALDRPERAIRLYEATIPELPSVYRRDRGVALSGLAAAYGAIDEPEQAAQVATEALAIAHSAGSARTINSLAAVGRGLRRHRALPAVTQFLDALPVGGPS